MPRILALTAILAAIATPVLAAEPLAWKPWSNDIFARAKAENRFVILDLQAVWCHWCHVMEETTYRDPKVLELLAKRYIAVQVDQDSSPELSARYGDWGWPATIVFGPDGTEIVKLSGYRPPQILASVLQAIIDDPSPGPSAYTRPDVTPAKATLLGADKRKVLGEMFAKTWDQKEGGWGEGHKLIIADSMDFALGEAIAGDKDLAAKARETLDKSIGLIDPVWGGIYQYSERGVWTKPHFEKIMSYQAQAMRQYSLGFQLFGDEKYLAAAKAVRSYLNAFMRGPEGAYYVSQDADLSTEVDGPKYYALADADRRKLGLPRIDANVYARENGWAISGLVALYQATGDSAVLADAEAAFKFIEQNRKRADGLYAHGAADRAGPFLGDTIAVGQAALELYSATGNRAYQHAASAAADGVAKTFKADGAGFKTAFIDAAAVGAFARPTIQIDENIAAARFFNLLARSLGKPDHRALAEHAMRFLNSDLISSFPGVSGSLLLLDDELSVEPMHVTIVGGKADAKSLLLHQQAAKLPATYKRLDWWDMAEGPMLNPDVSYPDLGEPAAFACSNEICSEPVTEPEKLAGVVERMLGLRKRRE